MNDDQLLRYSRHILLPQIGIKGQETLIQSHVLVVGAGGLGSPAVLYLAASGVGKLTICDSDKVDLTNLQRQIAHSTDRIGIPKSDSAKKTLAGINPEVNVIALNERMDERGLLQLIRNADVVVDASDNFPTRYIINRVCTLYKKPLVSGAVVRFDGQVAVFDLRHAHSPCYHCLFPADGEDQDMRCAVMGVFAPLVGVIGCVQAAETLKILLDIGQTLNSRLLLLDGLSMEWRSIRLNKDPSCKVCGTNEYYPKSGS
ncbi:molybdopterin/thiamine biosynthesis adenylyltransferase [Nitrosospira sp. Nsp5]|uniref:Molybdopterin or thiamine biosynthesis adenylyltransferase n=1 Tax=Nitrosospira multiformis TaxID=1231 RepID=A0ABY0TDL7_9PROT|nr:MULTISPECIES: HesA/MoeB/ThiF family protein [Nitrosospira]PTR06320.1 molybdopterin/thiamine biosynthesis adenylyltransferase [Nitrosospira sp. Nsp5]SDQ58599.1 Molybdopterin or thiamine biosynthesis adenylyltransferase [Nitrosospira multiformis]